MKKPLPIPPGDLFHILSHKHSPADGKWLWWGPNCAGYTTDLNHAGVYPRAQIEQAPDYFHNMESTEAIPVDIARSKAQIRVTVPFARDTFKTNEN